MADVKAGTNVSEIKKLEADLAQRRDALKTQLVAQAGDLVAQLKELGYFFSFSETAKIGRPKKGVEDGLA